jgi:molecular chaperone DnaK
MVYNIEKMLKENAEKIQGAEKSEVESALAEAKKVLEGSPSSSELKAANEKLTNASHKLAEVLYKANASQPAAGPAAGGPSDAGGAAGASSEHKKDEGVIDAEYVDVDEKK